MLLLMLTVCRKKLLSEFTRGILKYHTRAEIIYEKIDLPPGFEKKLAFVLHNVLTPEVDQFRDQTKLYPQLRFLRYDPGEYFKPHLDGIYVRDNGERSYVSVQLYLNEGFRGGATTFISRDEKELVPVIPRTGSALIFQHDILHEASVLKKGRKYAVRTDIMYAASPV